MSKTSRDVKPFLEDVHAFFCRRKKLHFLHRVSGIQIMDENPPKGWLNLQKNTQWGGGISRTRELFQTRVMF